MGTLEESPSPRPLTFFRFPRDSVKAPNTFLLVAQRSQEPNLNLTDWKDYLQWKKGQDQLEKLRQYLLPAQLLPIEETFAHFGKPFFTWSSSPKPPVSVAQDSTAQGGPEVEILSLFDESSPTQEDLMIFGLSAADDLD